MYKVQSVLKVQLCAASAGLVLHSLWYLQQSIPPQHRTSKVPSRSYRFQGGRHLAVRVRAHGLRPWRSKVRNSGVLL
jgi:hypothetical protein